MVSVAGWLDFFHDGSGFQDTSKRAAIFKSYAGDGLATLLWEKAVIGQPRIKEKGISPLDGKRVRKFAAIGAIPHLEKN